MTEKNVIIEDKDVNTPITALKFFMSLPDELLLNMIQYDFEGIYMMCLALGLELNDIDFKEKPTKMVLEA
jgi:hypothetical protein